MTDQISLRCAGTQSVRSTIVRIAAWTMLSGLVASSASAATIHAHRHHVPPQQITAAELASLRNLVEQWRTELASSSPAKYFQGLSLTNPDGTLKNHSFARLLAWENAHPASLLTTTPAATATATAPVLAHAAQIASQSQASPVSASISSPAKSAAYQVLIPPTKAASAGRQVLAAEVMPVPEPSSIVIALALAGMTAGWLRSRRAAP